jgi:signal transduction histidine kinase
MLEDFIVANKDAIIARVQASVGARYPTASADEVKHGTPLFLTQLCNALRLTRTSQQIDHDQIGQSATRHGLELFRLGMTIGNVVHGYGDLCQTITELAFQKKAPISAEDFKTLNLCLDDAIAAAVTQFSEQREKAISAQGTERLGIFAHELRRLLNTAVLSFESIQSGRVAAGGATALVHARSLMALRDLIDRSLAQVRLDVGLVNRESILVTELIEAVEVIASIQAEASGTHFVVAPGDHGLRVDCDREILTSAISNLLHNAFKFTRKSGQVSLAVRTAGDRVLIDVEDECGGLPPGKVEDLFRSFEQRGPDRTGIGLGLSISAKAAKANGGEVRVRDIPGKGCVFTLDLPKKLPPPTSV